MSIPPGAESPGARVPEPARSAGQTRASVVPPRYLAVRDRLPTGGGGLSAEDRECTETDRLASDVRTTRLTLITHRHLSTPVRASQTVSAPESSLDLDSDHDAGLSVLRREDKDRRCAAVSRLQCTDLQPMQSMSEMRGGPLSPSAAASGPTPGDSAARQPLMFPSITWGDHGLGRHAPDRPTATTVSSKTPGSRILREREGNRCLWQGPSVSSGWVSAPWFWLRSPGSRSPIPSLAWR